MDSIYCIVHQPLAQIKLIWLRCGVGVSGWNFFPLEADIECNSMVKMINKRIAWCCFFHHLRRWSQSYKIYDLVRWNWYNFPRYIAGDC